MDVSPRENFPRQKAFIRGRCGRLTGCHRRLCRWPRRRGAIAFIAPGGFPGAAIVLIQHVDAYFAPGLANWLASQTRLPIRIAADGDRPAPGVVFVTGKERHLVLTADGCLRQSATPADCSYRPSIDVFFRSAARFWRGGGVEYY